MNGMRRLLAAEPAKRVNRHLLEVLSLAPTPLLAFVTSATDLYMNNQALLQYQNAVLLPIVKLFASTMVVGLLFFALREYVPFRLLTWCYYLVAPVFLIFAFLRGFANRLPILSPLYETLPGLCLWPTVVLVGGVLLTFRSRRQPPVKPFAAFGVLLLASEIFSFSMGVSSRASRTSDTFYQRTEVTPQSARPNIYHLILDEFQTELFELALTPETEGALEGFVYFPNNTSYYTYTPWSLASVFSSRPFAYDRPRSEYIWNALHGRSSLLYWLGTKHYQTVAYVQGTPFGINTGASGPLFDHMVFHGDRSGQLLENNTEAFWNLWLYSNTPAPLREWLVRFKSFSQLTPADFEHLENRRLLPPSAPIVSYLGFQEYLREEKSLPESNRYTFVHLLLPHFPHKFGGDCSYQLGAARTGPLEQTKCTLKLVVDFIGHLKQLNRFEDSLIVIHGDHGGRYRVVNGQLTTDTRSKSLRTLLLVKPLGKRAEKLTTLEGETTLLDVAPAIMKSVVDASRDSGLSGDAGAWLRSYRQIVPFVEGEPLYAAEGILDRQGFTRRRVLPVESDDRPPGTVISQSPSGYTEVENLVEVSLSVVSDRTDSGSVVDDFAGQKIGHIVGRARRGEVRISEIKYVDSAEARGTVVGQSPAAGTRLGDQGNVVLYVSKGR